MSEKIHFVGVGGTGMSALAQFHAFGGGEATGSDRLLDRREIAGLRSKFEALGIKLFAQDGSGVDAQTARLVVSTAIEDSNPDLAKARALGLRAVHRADFLAEQAACRRTLAVTGTSGKSTVTAMIFEILDAAGRSPSVITGGGLRLLEQRGFIGNAAQGKSDLLVIEADESDGSLTRYKPWFGVLLNVGKDHKEIPALMDIFRAFRSNCGRFAVNADAPALAEFRPGALSFGFSEGCAVRGSDVDLQPGRVRLRINGEPFDLPLDGRHNAENALAAAAACLEAGVPLKAAAQALSRCQGVQRRFERLGSARGVTVVDDYAHNPDKVRAALAAAQACAGAAGRVLAVFQPHGYGPTRFLKKEFIEAFCGALREGDVLWMPEIYYAGGTAVKDISSADLAGPVAGCGKKAFFLADREDIIPALAREARPGDIVLVMGARDPNLSAFARRILAALG
ncbi:MAG: UDP-N-acetylmuramate--alanine ligase [Elusimicrobia bacterium]|nr:UDP-N-acetylmuramate--alanine ligase [Elusimicrobiota bacterium]